jgi:hypothetical protein
MALFGLIRFYTGINQMDQLIKHSLSKGLDALLTEVFTDTHFLNDVFPVRIFCLVS